MTRWLPDAGPLVAYFSEADCWHEWSLEQMRHLPPPLWTCESVLTEACFLIARSGGKASDIVRKVHEGTLSAAMDIETEAAPIEMLLRRCSDMPMSMP